MTKINDGGPAFPVLPPVDETGSQAVGYPYPDQGMSLRDWFAGQALSGRTVQVFDEPAEMAERCYRIADAMIAEREKK